MSAGESGTGGGGPVTLLESPQAVKVTVRSIEKRTVQTMFDREE
jgi:hypothetical protein